MFEDKDRHYKTLMSQYRMAQDDNTREVVRQEIWDTFGQKKVTLVTDMSGFTYLSHQYGSVHYLSMIEMMKEVVIEVVEAHKGIVVKCEADNTFCIFDDPNLAVEASVAINKELLHKNKTLEEKFHVTLSCGIACGTILLLEDDIFGRSVIIASKLGEDIATKSEILVSQSCVDRMDFTSYFSGKMTSLEVSKVKMDCFYIEIPTL